MLLTSPMRSISLNIISSRGLLLMLSALKLLRMSEYVLLIFLDKALAHKGLLVDCLRNRKLTLLTLVQARVAIVYAPRARLRIPFRYW